MKLAQAQTIEERFQTLASAWKAERTPTSLMTEMAVHPAYQQIIGLGMAAVPLLLRELQERPDHWFWALKSITGQDPVPVEDRGRMDRMTEHWLAWGQEHGHIAT